MSEFIKIATRPIRKFIKRRLAHFIRSHFFSMRDSWLIKSLVEYLFDKRPIVFSLVSNPVTNDARVLKEAEAIGSANYRVIVLGIAKTSLAQSEKMRSFTISRHGFFQTKIPVPPAIHYLVRELFNETIEELDRCLLKIQEFDAELFKKQSNLRILKIKENSFFTSFEERKIIEVERAQIKGALLSIRLDRANYIKENKAFLLCYYFACNLLSLPIRHRPEIIHAHDIYTLPGAIALSRLTGAKVIFDAHEIETERVPPLSPTAKTFVDLNERSWLKFADKMIVVSESIADFYSKRLPSGRPVVVANAPDFIGSHGDAPNIRNMLNLDAETPLAIYVGIIGREARGLHLVCEALQSLKTYNLAILGPRHAENEKWLTNIADQFGVAERIHFMNPVESHEVVETIRMADFGVIAIQDVSLSYRYCMPNKIFEMAFAELPICVSNLPEMARFVREFEIGLVMNESSPASIAQVMSEVYLRRAELKPTADKLNKMKSEYGWSTQVEKLMNIYAELKQGIA